jgi:hypothetical protein
MNAFRAPLLLLPLIALAGCGQDTARSLGFTRDAPDEFAVTTRAPLSVPPRLGELPVPTPGAPRAADAGRSTAAIVGAIPAGGAAPSGAERALLAQTGQTAPDNIRRQVDAESLRLDRPAPGLVDRLMFWRGEGQPGTPVDAQREAQRLRENAALGRETTDGVTPVQQPPASSSLFQRLFGS